MTAVLVVELQRALSRRLVRMLVLVALVGIVAIAIGAWVTSDADSPTAYSAADIWSGVDASGDANTLGSTSALFLFMGLLGGASFIGAEYRAGTIGTLLTWEPRRLRVIAAKLIAAGVVAGLLYFVLQAMLAVALVGVASGAGTTDGLDGDFYTRLGGLLVRGAVLTAGCAVLGGSLAALGRNTTAALGIVLGYLLVVENILRGLRPGWDEWLVIDNLFLVLVGRPEDSTDLQRSVVGAGILLVAYLAVLVSGTAAVFGRRARCDLAVDPRDVRQPGSPWRLVVPKPSAPRRIPVQLHGNAKLVPSTRVLLVQRVLEGGWRIADAAQAQGVSVRTAYRWVARWRAGDRELVDRSSAPRRVPRRTPRAVEALIERLRRLRMTSTRIAAELQMAVSTVGAVLARLGLNRLSRLEPPEPPNRYERRRPGELVHLDIKKLGRFQRPGHRVQGRGRGRSYRAGWEFVHVAVDDYSRVAYVEILADERATTCIEFLERALRWFAERAVRVERVISDNGSGYRARAFATACSNHGIRHLRTRPYRPRTNGKAERFIQTLLREWAYAVRYETSHHRALALGPWIGYYNRRRPHGALGHRTPATRLPAA